MHNQEGEEEAGENGMAMEGKRENSGREKKSRVQVIYAGCIISHSSAPHPPPQGSLILLDISPPHQGVLLLTVAPRKAPRPHQPWLRFCRDATAALCKWKTGHNFPKMLFFITYFPFISLLHTIDGWWHLWQLSVFMARFTGYLLLSFYSSNSVKMLIS